MKKTTLLLTASIFITASILTGCNTPAQKVENAQENVAEANKNLDSANVEYQADIDNCRKEANDKIVANDKSIADFKARINDQKEEARADYKNRLAELEQKNSDMKLEIDGYKADGKDNWEIFKSRFGDEMDKLDNSVKDFENKNFK